MNFRFDLYLTGSVDSTRSKRQKDMTTKYLSRRGQFPSVLLKWDLL